MSDAQRNEQGEVETTEAMGTQWDGVPAGTSGAAAPGTPAGEPLEDAEGQTTDEPGGGGGTREGGAASEGATGRTNQS